MASILKQAQRLPVGSITQTLSSGSSWHLQCLPGPSHQFRHYASSTSRDGKFRAMFDEEPESAQAPAQEVGTAWRFPGSRSPRRVRTRDCIPRPTSRKQFTISSSGKETNTPDLADKLPMHEPHDKENPVIDELLLLFQLYRELVTENSINRKAEIILRYPQLRPLLERMYDPDLRLYQTSKNLLRNVTTAPRPYTPWIGRPTPESLMQLLDQSSQGKARSAGSIERFMVRHGLIRYNDKEEVSLHPAWDIFSRVIDRDLKAGISGKTIRSLSWPGDSSDSVSRIDPSPSSSFGESDQPQMIRQRFRSSTETENSETSSSASGKNKEFSCVKGHSFTDLDNISGELAKYCDRWFVSRKLDGVRVLALMDFYVLNDASQPMTCVDIQFVSRTGITFSSLDKLKTQLKPLIDFPLLRHYLERDPMDISRDANGAVKRLVLDGEVCVMVPKDEQKATTRLSDRGLITPADQLWEDNGLTEDFSASVSGVTKNTTLEEPAYYAFDLLNWSEVVNRGAAKGDDMIGLTFGERIPELQALVLWLTQELQDREEKVVRITALNQLEIKATEMDESILGRAMDDGWEGLIFRADKPYVGTRTKHLRKFKKFQDAEYKVISVETNTMRLSIDRVFEERVALAKIIIEHEGFPVGVGSGFTAEERVKFAENPDLIIGKTVTVQYFGESTAKGRQEKSLRFPRVKAIYDGEREI